jgi:hypothetical protein
MIFAAKYGPHPTRTPVLKMYARMTLKPEFVLKKGYESVIHVYASGIVSILFA